MLNTILGSKQGMRQFFVDGVRTPVTMIKAGPCVVTQVRTMDSDGYWGIQLGFGEKRIKNTPKPLRGHLKGATKGKWAPRFISEVKLDSEPDLKVGDEVKISDAFSLGDTVTVTGISKGKGFAGVIKRWGFARGPRTHGQSDRLRSPGSIGQGTTPGRVHKGKKMGGRMGTDRSTVKNLKVVIFDEESGEIGVSGPVPGNNKSYLIVTKTATGKSKVSKDKKDDIKEEEVNEKVEKKGEDKEKD